jgi:hypothetical protein
MSLLRLHDSSIESFVLALTVVGSAFAQDGHERLASVGVSDIAPRELLSGRHKMLSPDAWIEGYLSRFDI